MKPLIITKVHIAVDNAREIFKSVGIVRTLIRKLIKFCAILGLSVIIGWLFYCRANEVSHDDVTRSLLASSDFVRTYPQIYLSPQDWKQKYGSEHPIVRFLCERNPNISLPKARQIIECYYRESQIESINVIVAISQMFLETSYLRFTGDISANQNNFAGIGCTHPKAPGEHFANFTEGIRAHIQHLKSYASKEPLRQKSVDPRRKYVECSPNFGAAVTVFDLAGKWATDPYYGFKIARIAKQLISL